MVKMRGSVAVGLFNRGFWKGRVTATWKDLGLSGPQPVYDLWQRKSGGTANHQFSALAGGNGMVVVPAAKGDLYVLSGADGSVQYANALAPSGLAIIGPPVVADGALVIGTTDGVVHAFSYPPAAAAAEAAARAGVAAAARRGTTAARCVAGGARLLVANCRLAVAASHAIAA